MKNSAFLLVALFLFNSSVFASEFVSDQASDEKYWDQVADELSTSTTSDDEDEIEEDDLIDEATLVQPVTSLPTANAVKKTAPPKMLIEIFKEPSGIGILSEFGILSIDGKVKRGFVVSTASKTKKTKSGNKPLTPTGNPAGKVRALAVQKVATRMNGERISLPYPFKVSGTYTGSAMYWALRIDIVDKNGGYPYWIHSTPHYDMLGKPDSMGCVRTTHPTAMELFDLAANKLKGSFGVRIYDRGSALAKKSIQEKEKAGLTLAQLKQDIIEDLKDAHAVTKGHYNGNGHGRRGKTLVYPKCGAYDCFKAFNMAKKLK